MVTARRLAEMDIPTRTDKRPTDLSPVNAQPAKATERAAPESDTPHTHETFLPRHSIGGDEDPLIYSATIRPVVEVLGK